MALAIRKEQNEYFPEVSENGRIFVSELCRKNFSAIEIDSGKQNSGGIYYNPLGNEIRMQEKNIPKDVFLSDHTAIRLYNEARAEFLQKIPGKNSREIARLANETYNELGKKLQSHIKKSTEIPDTCKKCCNFLQKNTKSIYRDFAKRTSVPMISVIDKIEQMKKKEIVGSSLQSSEKKKIIRYVTASFENFRKEFKNERIGISIKETKDPSFVYSAKNKNEIEKQIVGEAEGLANPILLPFLSKQNMEKQFPLNENPEKLRKSFEQLCIFSNHTVDEMQHAAVGEFGFSANRFLGTLAHSLEEEYFANSLTDAERKMFKTKCGEIIKEQMAFVKTGTEIPTAKDLQISYKRLENSIEDKQNFANMLVSAIGRPDLAQKTVGMKESYFKKQKEQMAETDVALVAEMRQ